MNHGRLPGSVRSERDEAVYALAGCAGLGATAGDIASEEAEAGGGAAASAAAGGGADANAGCEDVGGTYALVTPPTNGDEGANGVGGTLWPIGVLLAALAQRVVGAGEAEYATLGEAATRGATLMSLRGGTPTACGHLDCVAAGAAAEDEDEEEDMWADSASER